MMKREKNGTFWSLKSEKIKNYKSEKTCSFLRLSKKFLKQMSSRTSPGAGSRSPSKKEKCSEFRKKKVRKSGRLPRQCAHWLAMTRFFDNLNSLCKAQGVFFLLSPSRNIPHAGGNSPMLFSPPPAIIKSTIYKGRNRYVSNARLEPTGKHHC